MRKKKRNLIFIIVLVALAIGLGYAYLNSDLALNGYAGLSGYTWDVHWANLSFTTSYGVTCTQNPQIDQNDNTRIFYTCSLNVPGDYVEITVDAVNAGTIDAMWDAASTIGRVNNEDSGVLPSYYDFYFKNDNGTDFMPFQKLPANSTQTYIMKIVYDPDELLDTDQSVTVEIGLNFVQADERAVPKPTIHDVFARNNYNQDEIYFKIGYSLPEIQTYDSYEDVVDATYPIFLKHTLEGNTIKSTSIGIWMGGEPYYLCGAPPETDPYTGTEISPCYEENKNLIIGLLGNSDEWTCSEDESAYSCYNTDNLVLTNKDGSVLVLTPQQACAFGKQDGDYVSACYQ